MKAIFEFKCDKCGAVHERYIYSDLKNSLCGCGNMAYKIFSAPAYFKVDGFRSDIMSDSWAKKREDNARKKGKDKEA